MTSLSFLILWRHTCVQIWITAKAIILRISEFGHTPSASVISSLEFQPLFRLLLYKHFSLETFFVTNNQTFRLLQNLNQQRFSRDFQVTLVLISKNCFDF